MSGDACLGHRAGAVRQQGLMRYSQSGPLACDVTKEYSRGTPSYGYSARVPFRGPWLLWVRRSTAERPSPPRVCSDLHNNALTGSVPSSLSALTELAYLCVPASSNGVCACGRAGSDGSALLRERGMSGGVHVWGGAMRQQGLWRDS